MGSRSITFEEARNISIVELLAGMQCFPFRTTPREAWYLSPLRPETKPSFKVSLKINCWYDFGLGQGGGPVEFIRVLKNCTALEALSFLTGDMPLLSLHQYDRRHHEEPRIKILQTKEISDIRLKKYLHSRRISHTTAARYCKEVWYTCNDKQYFALGLQNRLDGWELRSRNFKTSSSPKSYTFLGNQAKELLVMEGMFEMLSLAELFPGALTGRDTVVLNSLSFLDQVEELFESYDGIDLCLDNDQAGSARARRLLSKYDHTRDRSGLYLGFKDLNEKLVYLGNSREDLRKNTGSFLWKENE